MIKPKNSAFTIIAARTECAKITTAKDDLERDKRYWRAMGYISALLVHQLIDVEVHEALMGLCGSAMRTYTSQKTVDDA